MKQPLVSICISCYNHEGYVRQALESAINQTYSNIQILISDDGSTDGSQEIIKDIVALHPDKNIRTFFSETNTTFSVMEEIYQNAEGDYLVGFSADDFWGETAVAQYVEFMEQHEEYAAAFSDPEIIWEGVPEGTSPFKAPNIGRHKLFEQLFCYGNFICAPSIIIRRSVWQEMGGYPFQYRQLQDYALWLQLLQKYDIRFFEKGSIPIYYRWHNNNLSMASWENLRRIATEKIYMLLDIMEQLNEAFFLKAFDDQIKYPADSTKYCLNCEKFMVLLHNNSYVDVNSAIMYYFKHIEESDFEKHIEKDYGFSRKDFHQLTGGKNPGQVEQFLQNTLEDKTKIIEKQNTIINDLMQKIQYLHNTETATHEQRNNIILITDNIYSKMLTQALSPDACVLLYLDFENYQGKSPDEQKADKEVFKEQLRSISSQMDEIDYVFSFVSRHYMPTEEELADWVIEELDHIGIPKYKFFDGFRIYQSFYPKEKYARILSNPDIDKLDGIVFGISHAEVGILSSLLPGRAANFASSSQDIYFNYLTAQKIWKEFPEKVSDLKYAVIDMFDYTYFNFETMLTDATINFFQISGLDCPALFDKIGNKNISASAEEINAYLQTQWPHATTTEQAVFSQLFKNAKDYDEHAYCDYPLTDRTRKLQQDTIQGYHDNPNITSIQINTFGESIERNLEYFCEFLRFLKSKNPDLVIFLCLLPKYRDVEEFEISQFAVWKEFFENLLSKVQKKVPFIYFNYKEDISLSCNPDYYWDMTHFNHDGSVAFTKKLANAIVMNTTFNISS